MHDSLMMDAIKMIGGNYLTQLPMLMVDIVALVVILINASKLGKAMLWALLGFGLALVTGLLWPVSHFVLLRMMTAGHSHAQMGTFFTVHSFVWGGVRAVAGVFLLLAIITGRTAMNQPPLANVPNPR